jgi:hypothetical protein
VSEWHDDVITTTLDTIEIVREESRAEERERIIRMIGNKICFGHLETGNCEHSVCHGMVKLQYQIMNLV